MKKWDKFFKVFDLLVSILCLFAGISALVIGETQTAILYIIASKVYMINNH